MNSLSPKMLEAVLSLTPAQGAITGHVHTLRALHRKGYCARPQRVKGGTGWNAKAYKKLRMVHRRLTALTKIVEKSKPTPASPTKLPAQGLSWGDPALTNDLPSNAIVGVFGPRPGNDPVRTLTSLSHSIRQALFSKVRSLKPVGLVHWPRITDIIKSIGGADLLVVPRPLEGYVGTLEPLHKLVCTGGRVFIRRCSDHPDTTEGTPQKIKTLYRERYLKEEYWSDICYTSFGNIVATRRVKTLGQRE